MSDQNPFGDIERAFTETLRAQLETVRELDGLEQDLNTWECSFLQDVLNQLEKSKRPLSQNQIEVVRRLCEDYNVDFDL
jgi:hypothetical protein